LAFLPLQQNPPLLPGPGIDAGSAWINASLLAANAPQNTIAGFRIKSGTADLQGSAQVVDGVLHLAFDAVLTLTLQLDPQDPNPDPGSGPGLDGRLAVAALPTQVTVQFPQFSPAAPALAQVTLGTTLSATAYGTAVSLIGTGQPGRYDPVLGDEAAGGIAVLPASPTPSAFTFAQASSTLLAPSGSAPITGGGWALPVQADDLVNPPTATTAGYIAVTLGSGLSLRVSGLGSPHPVTNGTLLVATGTVLLAFNAPQTDQVFALWQEDSGRRSSLDFATPDSAVLFYAAGQIFAGGASPGHAEGFTINGAVAAHFDRPVSADRSRLALQGTGTLTRALTTAGEQVDVTATLGPPASNTVLALENALLAVGPAQGLSVFGESSGQSIISGKAVLGFSLNQIVPTLPDPYVPSVSGALELSGLPGTVTATVAWTDATPASLTFSCSAIASPDTEGQIGLLDLSGNADQLGVELFHLGPGDPPSVAAFDMDGLRLRVDGGHIAIFTLPEISWEPMFNDPNEQSAAPPDAPGDGGTSTFNASTVQFVPVVPDAALNIFILGAQAGNNWSADLTLPFGLHAQIARTSNEPSASAAPNRPAFPNSLSGGRQVTFLPNSTAAAPFPSFPGRAFTVDGVNRLYGSLVLGTNVPPKNSNLAQLFNQTFRQSAPLLRYDLSGYGASVFSDWRNLSPAVSNITKVQFDVFIGRTSYEVVEEQDITYPWGVRIVRTVTIERKAAGGVIRHDSGWRASSDGRFDAPMSPTPVHLPDQGACDHITAVRNIQAAGAPFAAGSQQWQEVTFDADIVFSPDVTVTDGTGGSAGSVSRGMAGYILQNLTVVPPTPDDVAQLLGTHRASGPLSCTIGISSTKAKIRATLLEVALIGAGSGVRTVVVLRGVPLLPADGSWSVASRLTAANDPPQPLDPNFPVPLIRAIDDPTGTWHFHEPFEILQLDTPSTEYGWLQTTGTQKIFFGRPQLVPNQASFQLPIKPHLADVAALFNASGLFPDLGTALDFDQPTDLSINDNGVEIHRDFPIGPSVGPKTLMDFGAVKVLIDYEVVDDNNNITPAHAFIDIAPGSWQIRVENVTFPVLTPLSSDPKKPLLRITGNLQASSGSMPTLDKLDVKYGAMLQPVETIFCNLQQLAQFLPGGAGPKLDVSFSNGKLTISDVFTLPKLRQLGTGGVVCSAPAKAGRGSRSGLPGQRSYSRQRPRQRGVAVRTVESQPLFYRPDEGTN
jgi:hypothetical protein